MLDQYKREITYLRVSVTDRCNLRCTYCMPAEGIKIRKHEEILSYEEIFQINKTVSEMGISKVRLTGGEPLLRRNISYLIKLLKGIRKISEVSLTTNGILFASLAQELKKSGLDRINFSLDTLDPLRYKELTRGGDINKVLSGIEAAKKTGFKNTKLNMVLIPGFNFDEVESMSAFCRKNNLKLQRINHYSLTCGNNVNHNYEAERPLDCKLCNRIRLTADGMLKPCLFSDEEIPVDFKDIRSSILQAVKAKPVCGQICKSRGNWEIGG